ncbi:MAG TPA: hypothetical protein VKA48_11300 [Gammaproteobacteria bacterium]|nr:hypothetical protein [Gammaproteobacteria bacterium]
MNAMSRKRPRSGVGAPAAAIALGAALAVAVPLVHGQEADGDRKSAWPFLRKELFGKRPIASGEKSVVDLEAPYRAQDPATVPIRIRDKLPPTPTAGYGPCG